MSDEQYAKLDQRIVYSSLWEEDGDTCKVWITLLALKSLKTGIVDKNMTGIARLCKLPFETVEAAMNKFMEPDPNSSSKAHEGRRIIRVEGGWLIVNHERYTALGWSEEKKAYERERKKRYREKKDREKALKEEESNTEPEETTHEHVTRHKDVPLSVDEVIEYGKKAVPNVIPETTCRKFWAHYEGTAKTDPNGRLYWVTGTGNRLTQWRERLKAFDVPERGMERGGEDAKDVHNNGEQPAVHVPVANP